MLPANIPPPRTRFAAFALHTFAVYFIALHAAPWMIGRWFAWFAPVLHLSTSTPPADWALQHIALVVIVPSVLAGYVTVRQSFTLAPWAWAVPTGVLIYKMLVVQDTNRSVLTGTSVSVFKYYFDIQQVMPTFSNPLASDPVRVLAQLAITAPFYAGVAYAIGALIAKYKLPQKLFEFRHAQDEEQSAATAAGGDEQRP